MLSTSASEPEQGSWPRHVLGNLDHANIAHVVRAIGLANDTWPISTKDIL